MTRFAKTTFASLALMMVSASACQKEDDAADEYRMGVPRRETVELVVGAPAARGTTQALTEGASAQALVAKGAQADSWKTTRDVATTVNAGAVFVGALVKAVMSFPPTALTENSATWGPWTDRNDTITWRVTVTRAATNVYDYVFEGHDSAAPGAPFVKVLSGRHSPSLDGTGAPMEGFGAGTFTLDWNARNTLPKPERRGDRFANVGTAGYEYARTPEGKTDILAKFRQVWDDDENRLADLDYLFANVRAAGGSLDFVYTAADTTDKMGGTYAFRSRWKPTGEGRSDVKARGAAATSPITYSECWDTGTLSTFFMATWIGAPKYGNEAADCAFPTAEYSKL